MKKILIALLLILSTLLLFSCTSNEPAVKPTLFIDGVDISQYTVVIGEDTDYKVSEIAEDFIDFISEVFEVEIKIMPKDSDTYIEHAIYIGDNAPMSNEFKAKVESSDTTKVEEKNTFIFSADGHVYFAGNDNNSTQSAINEFKKQINECENTKVELSFTDAKTVPVQFCNTNEFLGVMSYNVKTGYKASRATSIFNAITDYDADIVGLQECGADWISAIKSSNLMETYTYFGVQREGEDDERYNEASPLLYKTEKFNCIKQETLWLTDTPRVISKLKSSSYYRIMTYAVLERKSDNVRFLVINVHPDYTKTENATQLTTLVNLANELNAEFGNLPTIFTGDYNCTMSGQGYSIMVNSELDDARKIAFNSTDMYTFPDGDNSRIIDFIFLSKGKFDVKTFSVKISSASDHYPIYAQIYLK